jgi:hypothetical protein
MQNGFQKAVAFVNTYSIWVVLGALSTAYFFYSYFNSHIHPVFFWLLPSCMWMIYTLDHVADGRKHHLKRNVPQRYSRNFFRRKRLFPVIAFLFGLNSFLAVKLLHTSIIWAGLGMAILSVLYLFWVHQKSSALNPWFKEVFVALMVTFGMGVLPLLRSETLLTEPHSLVLLAIFFLINLVNLMTFSHFDRTQDAELEFKSTALKHPLTQMVMIRRLLLLSYFLIAIWMVFLPGVRYFKALMVPLIMINVLMIINIWEDRFKDHDLYRFWGDFIYVMPGILSLWFGL